MTREEWLNQATGMLAIGVFQGHKIPQVKISVGFTGGGLKTLGAHWAPASSDDNIGQIYITPTQSDSVEVLAVLVHELCHAVVGNEHKHGKVFKRCAVAVGLEGKMTSTHASKQLVERLNVIVKDLGPIPHSKLNPKMNPKKKDGTRMIKIICVNETGYNVRMTQKWIDEAGLPVCACCDAVMKIDVKS